MLLLIVLGVVVLLALVVLGVLAHGVLGALGRVTRELTTLQREVAPVATELQASLTAAAASRDRPSDA